MGSSSVSNVDREPPQSNIYEGGGCCSQMVGVAEVGGEKGGWCLERCVEESAVVGVAEIGGERRGWCLERCRVEPARNFFAKGTACILK